MPIAEVELNKLLAAAQDASSKASDGDKAEERRAVDALKVLAQQQVTADLLAKTEAGRRVKKLSKHNISSIAAAAAAAVDAWKECVRLEQAGKASSKPTPQPSQNSGSVSNKAEQSSEAGTPSLGRSPSNKLVLEPAKTGDDTRDKIRKLLADTLASALTGDVFGDPCATAVSVEEAMYHQNGGVNAKYKAKFRTLSFNLKDPKNPELRGRVSYARGATTRAHNHMHVATIVAAACDAMSRPCCCMVDSYRDRAPAPACTSRCSTHTQPSAHIRVHKTNTPHAMQTTCAPRRCCCACIVPPQLRYACQGGCVGDVR